MLEEVLAMLEEVLAMLEEMLGKTFAPWAGEAESFCVSVCFCRRPVLKEVPVILEEVRVILQEVTDCLDLEGAWI